MKRFLNLILVASTVITSCPDVGKTSLGSRQTHPLPFEQQALLLPSLADQTQITSPIGKRSFQNLLIKHHSLSGATQSAGFSAFGYWLGRALDLDERRSAILGLASLVIEVPALACLAVAFSGRPHLFNVPWDSTVSYLVILAAYVLATHKLMPGLWYDNKGEFWKSFLVLAPYSIAVYPWQNEWVAPIGLLSAIVFHVTVDVFRYIGIANPSLRRRWELRGLTKPSQIARQMLSDPTQEPWTVFSQYRSQLEAQLRNVDPSEQRTLLMDIRDELNAQLIPGGSLVAMVPVPNTDETRFSLAYFYLSKEEVIEIGSEEVTCYWVHDVSDPYARDYMPGSVKEDHWNDCVLVNPSVGVARYSNQSLLPISYDRALPPMPESNDIAFQNTLVRLNHLRKFSKRFFYIGLLRIYDENNTSLGHEYDDIFGRTLSRASARLLVNLRSLNPEIPFLSEEDEKKSRTLLGEMHWLAQLSATEEPHHVVAKLLVIAADRKFGKEIRANALSVLFRLFKADGDLDRLLNAVRLEADLPDRELLHERAEQLFLESQTMWRELVRHQMHDNFPYFVSDGDNNDSSSNTASWISQSDLWTRLVAMIAEGFVLVFYAPSFFEHIGITRPAAWQYGLVIFAVYSLGHLPQLIFAWMGRRLDIPAWTRNVYGQPVTAATVFNPIMLGVGVVTAVTGAYFPGEATAAIVVMLFHGLLNNRDILSQWGQVEDFSSPAWVAKRLVHEKNVPNQSKILKDYLAHVSSISARDEDILDSIHLLNVYLQKHHLEVRLIDHAPYHGAPHLHTFLEKRAVYVGPLQSVSPVTLTTIDTSPVYSLGAFNILYRSPLNRDILINENKIGLFEHEFIASALNRPKADLLYLPELDSSAKGMRKHFNYLRAHLLQNAFANTNPETRLENLRETWFQVGAFMWALHNLVDPAGPALSQDQDEEAVFVEERIVELLPFVYGNPMLAYTHLMHRAVVSDGWERQLLSELTHIPMITGARRAFNLLTEQSPSTDWNQFFSAVSSYSQHVSNDELQLHARDLLAKEVNRWIRLQGDDRLKEEYQWGYHLDVEDARETHFWNASHASAIPQSIVYTRVLAMVVEGFLLIYKLPIWATHVHDGFASPFALGAFVFLLFVSWHASAFVVKGLGHLFGIESWTRRENGHPITFGSVFNPSMIGMGFATALTAAILPGSLPAAVLVTIAHGLLNNWTWIRSNAMPRLFESQA